MESNNPYNCPAIKAYKIGKALNHVRKALDLFDELGVLNSKIEGDFEGILQFCSEFSHEQRLLKGKNEN